MSSVDDEWESDSSAAANASDWGSPVDGENMEEEGGDNDWGDSSIVDNETATLGTISSTLDGIAPSIRRLVQSDLSELKYFNNRFSLSGPTISSAKIHLRVGFPIINFGLETEQLLAYGLDGKNLLIIDITFPTHYFQSSNPSDIKVLIKQASTINDTTLHAFRLSWSLENRVKREFLIDYFHSKRNEGERGYDVSDVEDIKEATEGVPYLKIIRTLKTNKGNKDKTISQLIESGSLSRSSSKEKNYNTNIKNDSRSESFGQRIMSSLRSATTSFSNSASASSSPVKSKRGSNKYGKHTTEEKSLSLSNEEQINQIMSLCNVSRPLAARALMADSRIDAAVLLLMEQETRQELERMCAEDIANIEDEMIDSSSSSSSSSSTSLDYSPMDEALYEEIAPNNPLLRLIRFVEKNLSRVSSVCMLCGNDVEYPGLKPSICGSSLCKMGLEELSICFDLSAEILSSPELCDALITFAYAAAMGNRIQFHVPPTNVYAIKDGKVHNFLFEEKSNAPNNSASASVPYYQSNTVPAAFPNRGGGGAAAANVNATNHATESNNLDLEKIRATLNLCPPVTDLVEWAKAGNLEEKLNAIDPLLSPFLRWIFTSNRSHLRLLSPSERVSDLGTDYQFALLSATPEHEAKFQKLKKAAATKKGIGSIFTFHGSSLYNWHSILRVGLKNMSGTKFQENGAAYGAGIYMATDSATSLGYCRSGSGWGGSTIGTSITALALCEVVNDVNQPNPYYVVKEEEKIVTRFIFLFPNAAKAGYNAAALQAKLPKLMSGLTEK